MWGEINEEKFFEELNKCRRCKFCVDECPVYLESQRIETMSPFGRVQILKYLLKGWIELDDVVITSIYTCLRCNRCIEVCKDKGVDLKPAALIRLGKAFLTKNLLGG